MAPTKVIYDYSAQEARDYQFVVSLALREQEQALEEQHAEEEESSKDT
jgi:hypothetical protein